MKKNLFLLFIMSFILITSCSKKIGDVNYTPFVKINFTGVGDSNKVVVNKGASDYTAKINVNTSGTAISLFQVHNADALTGAKGSLITETSQYFANGQASYTADYTVSGLTEDKAIKVVVTDTLGNVFERNLLIKITPSVIFSNAVQIETAEALYGSYYATWLNGQVYMRRDEKYKSEIDLSVGDVTPTGGATKVPLFVNPANRSSYGLLTMNGLQDAKFALTNLTKAQYDNVTMVDPAPINALADPVSDTVRVEAGKVFLFKTANNKKGLVYVSSLTSKTGTIENKDGQWVPNITYYLATITTKTVVP